MNGQQLHNVKVLKGLTVTDLDGNNSVVLSKAFTKNKIPATNQDIPRPELVKKWPHLEHIADRIHPVIPNVKIGLLIGTNCPKALEPKDVVSSKNGGPFVIQTFAGWTVVGPLVASNSKCRITQCNRTVTKEMAVEQRTNSHFVDGNVIKEIISPQQLNKMMELDFSERNNSSKYAYSQEDRLFLAKAEYGIRRNRGHYVIPLPFRENEVVLPNNKVQAEQQALSG